MKRVLFSLVAVLVMVQSSVAYMATNSPIGAWRFSSKERMSSSSMWYASDTNDLVNLTFHEYVTYNPEHPGWIMGTSGGEFRVYETWVRSENDATLYLSCGGDDGHSVFVDGAFVAGGGFAVDVHPVLELQEGIARRLLLTSNNAGGLSAVNFFARLDESDDFAVIDSLTGVTIHAEGGFPPVLPGGPVAYYPLNGDAGDASGNAFHGVVNGAVPTRDRFGNVNGAYAFDGDDYIETPSLELDTTEGVTLACWARLNDVDVRQGIMGTLADAPGNYPPGTDPWNRHYLGVREGNYWTGAGNTQRYVVEADGVAAGDWFFFAVTMEQSNAVYYVNGVEVDSTAYGARGVCDLATHIGAINDRGTASAFLEGAIDDVRIYDRALSAAEIAALHDAPGDSQDLLLYCNFDENVEDRSGNGTHGTLQGQPGWVQGVDGSAIEMSGGNSWVEFPRAPLNPRDEPMSISVWASMSQTPTSEYQKLFIIANALNEQIGGAIWAQISSDTGERDLTFGMRSDTQGSQVSCVPSDVFSDGGWHHLVAIRRSTSVLEMWVDGSLVSTVENGQLGDVDVEARDSYGQLDPDIPAFLGYSPRGRWFDGKVDELRIYSKALSPESVTRLYQDGTNGVVQPEHVGLVVAGMPSGHGVSSPYGYGSNSVVLGSVITETVNSPVMDGERVRYACIGWSGTGSVPTNGSGNTVEFAIAEDSSLTWQWERQVKLTLTGNAGGSVDADGEWFTAGAQAELVAAASNGYAFIGWQGDVPGHYSTENPLSVTMVEPRAVKALFWDTNTELGMHWVEGGTYFPGINRVECRFYVPNVDNLLSLVWRPELPTGWSLVSAKGDGGPYVVAGDVVFTRNHVSNPVRFSCLVSVPAAEAAEREISAVATYQVDGMANPKGMQVVPHPLVVNMHGSGFHSADYQDLPWVIDAHELNRVLSYWRAGYYRPDPEGLDGFVATTERYRAPFENGHSADFSPGNWRINAHEANRVLAYWRAGGYRINPHGKDGFAPVKYGSAAPSANSIASLASAEPIEVLAAGGGYDPGGTVVITNTVSFESSLLALAIRPDLPDGWTLQHVQAPANPEWTDTEILWTGTLPSSPVTIVMTISVPVTSRGDRTVEGVVDAYEESATNSNEVAVPPVGFAMDATDADGDGLPDAWESAFSADGQGLDPDVDSDRDGLTNWKEWYAGTDPTNATSTLVFGDVNLSGGVPQLSWQSAQDRTYSVLFGSNLVDGMTVLTNGVSSTPPTNSMAMPADWPKEGFFRIRVE